MSSYRHNFPNVNFSVRSSLDPQTAFEAGLNLEFVCEYACVCVCEHAYVHVCQCVPVLFPHFIWSLVNPRYYWALIFMVSLVAKKSPSSKFLFFSHTIYHLIISILLGFTKALLFVYIAWRFQEQPTEQSWTTWLQGTKLKLRLFCRNHIAKAPSNDRSKAFQASAFMQHYNVLIIL